MPRVGNELMQLEFEFVDAIERQNLNPMLVDVITRKDLAHSQETCLTPARDRSYLPSQLLSKRPRIRSPRIIGDNQRGSRINNKN